MREIKNRMEINEDKIYDDLEDIERKHLQINPYLVNQMGGDVIAEGGYGCVYHPSILCSGKEDTSKNKEKYLTKLQPYDHSAKNEILIGEKIKKIPKYENHFSPIVSMCPIQIGEIEDGLVKQCSLFKKPRWKKNKDNEIMIMKMNYIQGDILSNILKTYNDEDKTNVNIKTTENNITITKTMNNSKEEKQSVKQGTSIFISTYEHLLDSLELLYDNDIIHYDFKGNNVMYDKDKNKPIIIDFGLSIDLTSLKTEEDYEHTFYVYAPDYYLWCPEIVMLSYLYSYKRNPTLDELETIAMECAMNNPLHYFYELYDENSREMYATELHSYFIENVYKKSLEEATENLMKHTHTWDNYSLSIMYGNILSSMIQEKTINELSDMNDNNIFIVEFFNLLLKNVSANPENRYSIQETKQEFQRIMSGEGNYSKNSLQQTTKSLIHLTNEYLQSLDNGVFQTKTDELEETLKQKTPSTKTMENIMIVT